MLARMLRTWRSLRVEMGTPWAMLYVLHRALQFISRGHARVVPYALYAQPLGADAFTRVRDAATTQVALTPPDAPWINDFPRPADVVAARFAAGAQCFTALVRGEFAGHIWLCSRSRWLQVSRWATSAILSNLRPARLAWRQRKPSPRRIPKWISSKRY